jgi:hypothetical protein
MRPLKTNRLGQPHLDMGAMFDRFRKALFDFGQLMLTSRLSGGMRDKLRHDLTQVASLRCLDVLFFGSSLSGFRRRERRFRSQLTVRAIAAESADPGLLAVMEADPAEMRSTVP